jgi:hypothetical protein
MTEQTKRKISLALKGRPARNKGVPHTQAHREKISAALTGIVFTDERRKHISDALKGKTLSVETRCKIAATLTGRKNPEHSAFMTGRRLSAEAKDKVRRFQLGRSRSPETRAKLTAFQLAHSPMRGRCGPLSPNWIVDRSKLAIRQERNDSAYKDWRRSVRNRDGWLCKMANGDCSGKVVAHHILPWSKFPKLHYEPNNGITLCRFHHPRKREDEIKLSPYFQSLVRDTAN